MWKLHKKWEWPKGLKIGYETVSGRVVCYFGNYELWLRIHMKCMDPLISKKESARVNGYHSMNSKEQLYCIGLVLVLWSREIIIQQVMRGKFFRLCHPYQWINGALLTQRKWRWPTSIWLTSTFKNKDTCHVIWILHWTTFQINQRGTSFDVDYIDGLE